MAFYALFDQSQNTRNKMLKYLRESVDCPDSVKSVYDCYRNVSLNHLITAANQLAAQGFVLQPIADGDFFPDTITSEIYDKHTHRWEMCVWAFLKVSHNALFWNSQASWVNHSVLNFDWVFLGIQAENCIVGILLRCPMIVSASKITK